ncbi:2-oxoglutarate dehydrogenase E1 component [Gammaproteobacteria bacterium]|nr:2-oxoglutarate dehydrogenase E1 component [Gammaproteobacteria bacterium]
MINNEDFISTSHAGGGQASYLESLYESYLKDPSSIPEDWMHYFNSLPRSEASGEEASHQEVINRFKIKAKSIKPQAQKRNVEIGSDTDPKQIKVIQLIQAYRNRGHHKATLDPLSLKPTRHCEDLELSFHGLDQSDLEKQFSTDSLRINKDTASLAEIISSLEKIYCGNLGIEYNYISSINERQWFQQRLEPNLGKIDFTDDEKVYIYKRLSSADGLAKFLASRYPGMKRFGIEGAESLIPLVDSLIQNCGIFGAQQICFGMAHRGRLNLLVNVLGKSPKELFAAFEEDFELEGASTGDVKYHLGFSSNILTPNGEVHVSLGNNPSHLEIVNPVVVGSVRARQDRLNDSDQNLVVPILIHGDAAFSGQGVVMETLQMSQTRGYGVGGSIHVIVNNQIGFTTSSEEDSRSGPYATDVAKIIEAPILHVNGDDPEMVVFAAKLACEYRNFFKKDIVLDMFCFRRKGHNEADEPSSTQPMMYQAIKNHPSVTDQYQERLIREQALSLKDCDEIQKNYRTSIEKGDNVAHNLATKPNQKLWFDWTPYMNQTWKQETDTSFDENNFTDLAKNTFSVPQNFEPQKQVEKLLNDRLKMADGQMPVNWGFAENMAYATLLTEGYPIRFTGQDVRRGTFSHRHAVLHNQKDGLGVMPLIDAANNANTTIDIYDSLLSEEAVLGFEYGYSATRPSGLVIWEAQFGDFANGAQVVIDQFVVSAEHKWERLSGLVMLLPHGYEGQGPEHSSARLERFLQLCADENIQVCVPSTPAQIFHLLRLQTIRKMRRPLIVIAPKSLLRNSMATSELKALTHGKFQYVIDDRTAVKKAEVTKIILCSGKVFYDLLNKKNDMELYNIALIRIEQLYSFPYDALEKILLQYDNAEDFIWCQEEPANQGAWFSHRHRIQRVLDRVTKNQIRLVSRPAAAAPAVGLNKLHNQQQEDLVVEALTI